MDARTSDATFKDTEASLRWQEHAACKGMPITVFFNSYIKKAKATCSKCSVTKECLEYAEKFERAVGVRSGIYGNQTAKERDAAHPLGSARGIDVIFGPTTTQWP